MTRRAGNTYCVAISVVKFLLITFQYCICHWANDPYHNTSGRGPRYKDTFNTSAEILVALTLSPDTPDGRLLQPANTFIKLFFFSKESIILQLDCSGQVTSTEFGKKFVKRDQKCSHVNHKSIQLFNSLAHK